MINLASHEFISNTLQNTVYSAVNKLPIATRQALRFIPNRMHTKALELAINNVFEAALLDGELDFLTAKWLKISVTDIGTSWFISQQYEGEKAKLIVSCTALADDSVDVCIKGSFNNFVLLASNNADPDTLFFNRQLLLTGNTELGLEIKSLLENFEATAISKHLSKLLHWHSQQILNAPS
ncbi:MAG: SCP2 sterol-binding domain-containing protein [Oceanospirillaceae bacterium]